MLTFLELNGNEVFEAVTMLSDNLYAEKRINFLRPNEGPGCVNHNVDFILCLLSNLEATNKDTADM